MPVLFMDLAVRAGLYLPKYKGKYNNAWVIAVSRYEAKPDGKLQKPTLITQQGAERKAHFKTTDYTLKTLIETDAIL